MRLTPKFAGTNWQTQQQNAFSTQAARSSSNSTSASFCNNIDRFQRSRSDVKFSGPTYTVTDRNWYMIAYNTVYPDRFLDDIHSGMEVLDVGAGGGSFAKDLKVKKGCNVTAIDKEVGNDIVEKKDIKDLTADTYHGKFDRIFCSWSLFTYPTEDWSLQAESLKKMAAWLKPGGKIRISPVNESLKNNAGFSFTQTLAYVPELKISDSGKLGQTLSGNFGGLTEPIEYIELQNK